MNNLVLKILGHETLVTDSGGDLPPMVLIHGFCCDHQLWNEIVPLLKDTRRVITYDVRGLGHAINAKPVNSLVDYAVDLKLLLDQLNIQKAHIVGFSLGGIIAQYFALNHPEYLLSLALACTTAKPKPVFIERAKLIERQTVEEHVAYTLGRWFAPHSLQKNIPGIEYLRQQLHLIPAKDWIKISHLFMTVDTFHRLNTIRVPTQIIAGEYDNGSTPESMREMAQQIPGAHFHIVKDCSHMVCLENPAALAKILLNILSNFTQYIE